MDEYKIKLGDKELALSAAENMPSAEELLSSVDNGREKVEAKTQYKVTLTCNGSVKEPFDLEVNGFPVTKRYDKIFQHSGAGLAQLCVKVDGLELYSDWVTVTVDEKTAEREHQLLTPMIEEIYAPENYNLLYSDIGPNLRPANETPLTARASMARLILETFRRLFPSFRDHGVSAVLPGERVGGFERLRAVTPRTVAYIARHPSELEPAVRGISAAGRTWQPRRTLIGVPGPSPDTYENRAVLGFIRHLTASLSKIKTDLETKSSMVNDNLPAKIAVELMKKKIAAFPELITGFKELGRQFAELWDLDAPPLAAAPRPTPVFLNVPHYRELFSLMEKWYRLPQRSENDDRQLLAMMSSFLVYERYVLVRLIRYFKKQGELVSSKLVTRGASGVYRDPECNNVYEFDINGEQVYLYYQPQIWHTTNETGLHLTYDPDDDKPQFHMPDYIVKMKNKAYILDAKYRRARDIIRWDISDLLNKYMFSVKPKPAGVYILCAKDDKRFTVSSEHNSYFASVQTLRPKS